MAQVICQACGKPTKEGGFCSKCGAALTASSPSSSGAAPSAFPPASAPPAAAADGADDRPTRESVRPPAELRPARAAADAEEPQTASCPGPEARREQSHATTSYSVSFDDCPWVWVERDTLAFCVEKVNTLMRLRVSAHIEGIDDLRVSLCPRHERDVVWDAIRWPKPAMGKYREFTLIIPPLSPGVHAAEIRMSFVKGRQQLEFKCPQVVVFVYPEESSAKQIAESIVVNITNDIKTGHASDVHLSQDAADAIGKFTRTNGSAHSLTELLNLMKSDQRAFRRDEFDKVGSKELGDIPTPPPDEALTKRITLSVGGRLLHLYADRRLTLGRNRANGLVTRRFDAAGAVSEKLGERISKFHCTLALDGGDCVVYDGALDESGRMKPSSWGVFWQGQAVKGSIRFPVERFPKQASLGFAGAADACDFGLAVQGVPFDQGRCAKCSSPVSGACLRGKIPAVLLRRTDGVPESYALLWSCLDLGCVFPVFSGLVVCHEQGAFSWRSAGDFGWLVPGRYASSGTEIAVRSFSQYGL